MKILKGNSVIEAIRKQIMNKINKFPREIRTKEGTYNFTFIKNIKKNKYIKACTKQIIINPILWVATKIPDFIKVLIAPFLGKVINIILIIK